MKYLIALSTLLMPFNLMANIIETSYQAECSFEKDGNLGVQTIPGTITERISYIEDKPQHLCIFAKNSPNTDYKKLGYKTNMEKVFRDNTYPREAGVPSKYKNNLLKNAPGLFGYERINKNTSNHLSFQFSVTDDYKHLEYRNEYFGIKNGLSYKMNCKLKNVISEKEYESAKDIKDYSCFGFQE